MMMIKNTTLSFLLLTGMLSGSSANICMGLGQTDCENADDCQASFRTGRFLECVPKSCRVLSSQRDCERVRGCRFAGRCSGFRPENNCGILSQRDCENALFCSFSGSCFGTPRTGTAAEAEAEADEEALLSLELEAAADDPTYHGMCLGTWNKIGCESLLSRSDCENATFCSWIPFGNSAEAEGEALLSLEAAADDRNYERTRTNLRGWN